MLKKSFFMFFLLLILFSLSLFSKSKPITSKEVVFVVNKDVVEDSLTRKELQKILFGKKKKWKNHSNIILVLPENEDIIESALKEIKKSKSQFDNTWKKLIFTGKRKAPVKLKTEKEIIDFIKKTPGAISIIEKSDKIDKNLKIIQIIKR